MAVLYIVATPIGNLEDISNRALRILSEVDFILAEDTRVSRNLLNHFNIKTKLIAYHQHSQLTKVDYIIDLLKQDKNIALISDAGTPGISDPGNKLISLAIEQLSNLTIIPIPGASAVTSIASVSGFPMDKFIFLGFPPAKKKRKQFFEEMINSKYPVIFFESPHRILKTLSEISKYRNIEMSCVVGRELTKKFETIYRGTIDEVVKKIENDKVGGRTKGEFVVVINSKN